MGATPKTPPPERVKAEFLAAITCKHGHAIAPHCGQGCRRENWLDSVTRTEPGAAPRTVADVVAEFVPHRIPSIEVVERYLDEKGRPTRTERRTMQKLAIAAGATIIGGLIIFKGGKLVFRLFTNIRAKRTT